MDPGLLKKRKIRAERNYLLCALIMPMPDVIIDWCPVCWCNPGGLPFSHLHKCSSTRTRFSGYCLPEICSISEGTAEAQRFLTLRSLLNMSGRRRPDSDLVRNVALGCGIGTQPRGSERYFCSNRVAGRGSESADLSKQRKGLGQRQGPTTDMHTFLSTLARHSCKRDRGEIWVSGDRL